MVNIAGAPTLSNVRWGPERWQILDYWAHPVRDDGGNPVLIWRHGGGGVGGDQTTIWGNASSWSLLFKWINSSSRSTHFDIISIESGQRVFTLGATTTLAFPRTKQMYLHDSIIDLKRGICAVKAFGLRGINYNTSYKINKDAIVLAGQSHGATLSGLVAVTPTITMPGGTYVRQYEPNLYDSSVLGCFYYMGQCDVRTTAGVNYIDPSLLAGWAGTYYGAATEWNALPDYFKESMSLRWYIENNPESYVPLYVAYPTGGDHVHPYTNAHDSQQLYDMKTSLDGARLTYEYDLVDSTISNVQSNRIYSWAAGLVRNALAAKAKIPGNTTT